jgi:molybdenum cofactor cytidylyltransferase
MGPVWPRRPTLLLDPAEETLMIESANATSQVTLPRQPVVLVLASGRGERFRASGGVTHKLQALLGDRSVLEHTLAAVRDSGLPWHLESDSHPGMGDSIAAAARATADAPGWLILPADLPLVSGDTIRRVAQALDEHTVVQPAFAHRLGHPVGFASACGPALRALSGPQGAASVLRAFPAFTLDVDDIGCVTDIDTVDDLDAARRLLDGHI